MTIAPEAAAAIEIADKHLAGEPIERRSALAQDIVQAIIRHAGSIAEDVIIEGLTRATGKQRSR